MAYDIVYLVDCSRSMNEHKGLTGLEGSKLDLVKKCIAELLGNEKAFNPEDRVALLSFKGTPLRINIIMPLQEVIPLIMVHGISQEQISALKAGGNTPIGSAVKEALKLLTAENERGKGILLITDGSNNEGENPGLFVCEALKQNVRIDVVGLGASVDEFTLKALAEKTGGIFKYVTHANELNQALIWQGAPIPLRDETAELRALDESLRKELKHLDEAYAGKEVTAQKYAELKSTLQSKILNLKQEFREKRAQASRELAGFHLEREKLIHQLADLKAKLDGGELDEKTYLKLASPIEEKIAFLNRELPIKQKTLTSLS
jgi:uncharacterized protein YegL